MSYYRVRAEIDDMLHPHRRIRSCSLPREVPAFAPDRHMRARSVGPVDHISAEPAMLFSRRAASLDPFDYLEFSRSRYARNLPSMWYSFEYSPRFYSNEYCYPRTQFYDFNDHLPASPYFSSYGPSRYATQESLTPSYGYHHYKDPYSYNDYRDLYGYNDYKDLYGYNHYKDFYGYNHYKDPYDPYQSSHGYGNPSNSLSDYYGSSKYADYVHSSSTDVLGRWKHYNRSSDTLNTRNSCADSPLVSRELNRYFSSSGKTDNVADMGTRVAANFRHYNYRSVPYFGASDNYHNLNKMFQEQNRKEGRAF